MNQSPFERDGQIDKPGIVGARWWQKSLVDAPASPSRRSALGTTLALSLGLAGMGACVAITAASSGDGGSGSSGGDDTKTEPKDALTMQKEYGWNFGAHADPVTFDGAKLSPFYESALATLNEDLKPGNADYSPYYSPTLFQSPSAMPTKTAAGDPPAGFKPLKDVVQPISTPQMDDAYARGRALAGLLTEGGGKDVAVIVDLPGPEAVAFAAGMAGFYDPVFLFENWPHPRGVVKAHLTLGAALYYQPLFAKRKKLTSDAPPVFVLDRNRLTPYTDENNQFDNRFVAKLPSAASLKTLKLKRVLYITPYDYDDKELDDVNDDLVAYDAAGLDVRMLGASSLKRGPGKSAFTTPDESEPPPAYYYGSESSHGAFYGDYLWFSKTSTKPSTFSAANAKKFKPQPRPTSFSTGTKPTSPASGPTKPRPLSFATVAVVVIATTGIIQGAKLSRSGSWNRAGGGGYGG